MPLNKYIKVAIDEQELELSNTDELPVAISYKLEDGDDFQSKKSSELLNLKVPATPANDKIANTFHNPGIEDLTPNETYKNFRKVKVEANGHELIIGKALLQKATHNLRPKSYEFDLYGNNGDWLIDLKETTLYDLLKHLNFTFTKQGIIDSWGFDGTNEDLPYVFAPVRYGQQMDDFTQAPAQPIKDRNMKPEYMRPALSKYWLVYWAFKTLGYKISSDFFDKPFFRRQVMPWTWGNFLFSDGTRLNNLDFLAKSTATQFVNFSYTGFWDLDVSNDSTNGGFDNNGVYSYIPSYTMQWTYNPAFNYGSLLGTFHLNVFLQAVATANSDVEVRVQYFKNGIRVVSHDDNGNGTELLSLHAPAIGRRDFIGNVDDWLTVLVDPGDEITAKIYLHTFNSGTGISNVHGSVDAFELDYFRIPLGGIIDFQNYVALKKLKFLDFLRGIVDEFNLMVGTDPINKTVHFEPQHEYSVTNNFATKSGGYFNGKYVDWERKQDLSKDSDIILFSESERELIFKYKDDNNDGILKTVQDRFVTTLAAGKYVFPDRFKAGKKEIENRFFSPVMHYEVEQWKGLGTDPGESPQMICLIPENISNTSREEAQNTFEPKSAYYKGLVTNVGWVFDNDEMNTYPYMFAVNYKPGGQNDPILSYSDERIGKYPDAVIGKGLLKRFYWQRMAIMRNGQYYNPTFFKLNNIDITNWLHREHIICRGQRWELIEIREYQPLKEESTECFMRKWSPIKREDFDNTYPAADNVLEVSPNLSQFDIKYSPLKCLFSDITIQ
jgi:hypothetical protein